MSENPTQFDTVMSLALKLSLEERVRLAKRILETVEGDLPAETGKEPRLSLYGALADLNLNVSEEDIAEVRREMLANFPREDIA